VASRADNLTERANVYKFYIGRQYEEYAIKAPVKDLFLSLSSPWVRKNVMSWMPGRRRTPRLGDVFGCTFLFVLSFSLVLGTNTAICFSLAHVLRVLWMVDPSLVVRPCFRWSTLVCSFDPSLVDLVRPFVGRPRSTLLSLVNPCLLVRPFVGRPRSTLVRLVDHPLLVRPLFGQPRSTLFSLLHPRLLVYSFDPAVGRPCSTLLFLVHPPLLVRPWFGWSTLFTRSTLTWSTSFDPDLVGQPLFTRSTLRWSTSSNSALVGRLWFARSTLLQTKGGSTNQSRVKRAK
jgi:hypothetical protein